MAANRLARWQYDYTIEYRKTSDHGNADALSRLPVGPDVIFDEEEDTNTICTVHHISRQLDPRDPGVLANESNKDSVIAMVMKYTREGWPQGRQYEENLPTEEEYSIDAFKKVADSLSTSDRCLFYGA